jgi:hypothetical protein
MTIDRTARKSLIAEVVATLDEHLDGVTTEEEATSLIRAALRRHAALCRSAADVPAMNLDCRSVPVGSFSTKQGRRA